MPQSSFPLVDEQFTDANWRDLFGDEAGVVGDMDGSAYKLALPTDSDVVSVGSTTQRSIAKVAGFAHLIPAGETEPITVPAAFGSARTDIVALKYDPANTGDPGPVRLVRVAGTTTALPVYDDAPPGVEFLPLWAITRQPGQALSQATLQQLFSRLAPVLNLPVGAPLPTSSPLGTIVRQGSLEFTRTLDASSVPVWSAWPVDSLYVNIPLNAPFVAVTAGVTPGAKYRIRGGDTSFSMRITRTTAWTAGSGLAVGKFPTGARPSIPWYFRVTKDATDGTASGLATVEPDGDIVVNISGQAGNSLYISGKFPNG